MSNLNQSELLSRSPRLWCTWQGLFSVAELKMMPISCRTLAACSAVMPVSRSAGSCSFRKERSAIAPSHTADLHSSHQAIQSVLRIL